MLLTLPFSASDVGGTCGDGVADGYGDGYVECAPVSVMGMLENPDASEDAKCCNRLMFINVELDANVENACEDRDEEGLEGDDMLFCLERPCWC